MSSSTAFKLSRSLLALTFLCISLSPAKAGIEAGVAAYNHGDYRTAMQELRPLAEAGRAEAQNYLGMMYYHGRGAPKIYSDAANWFRQAAEQGHAGAQNWMAILSKLGHGVIKDYEAANAWFRRAAEQGDAHAKFNLGGLYEAGHGVSRDDVQAYKWYYLATLDDLAGKSQAMALEARNSLAVEMTGAKISEAERLAEAWLAEDSRRR